MPVRLRRLARAVAILAALHGPPSDAAAQTGERTNWRFLTSADDLVESWTFDVTRGPSGRLFISHGDVPSLSVFDGYRIDRLPSPGPYLTVREGEDGVLWAMLRQGGVGNFRYLGLQRLEGGRWVPYPLGESVGPSDANTSLSASSRAFLPIERDRVLVVGGGRLLDCRVKDGALVALTVPQRRTVRFLVPARRGGAWVATDGGIARVHVAADGSLVIADEAGFPAGAGPMQPITLVDCGAAGLFVTLRGTRGSQSVDVVARDLDGRWRELRSVPTRDGWQLTGWAGTDGQWWASFAGDAWFELGSGTDAGDWRPLPRMRELAGRLHNMLADPDGGFWLATSTGLAHHVPTLWRTPRELVDFVRPASTIFEARNGDLLIQHDTELLYRRGDVWRAFPLPSRREGGLVRTDGIVELPDGRILLGGRPTPAMFFDRERGTFTSIVHPKGRFVEVLNAARDGGAWMLTTEANASQRRHIEKFDGTTFTDWVAGSDRWRTLPPRGIVDLSDGRWLVVPDGDGYGEGRGRTLTTIGAADGLPYSPITALEVTPGRVWFGSRDDVFERTTTGWRVIRSGLQSVRSIVKGRDGTIWVASASGVHALRDGAWLSAEGPEGLPDGAVFDVLEDSDGSVWASTLVGIARREPGADGDPPETIVDEANPREAPPSGDLRLVFKGIDRWQLSPAARLLYSWRTDGGPWSPYSPVPTASFTRLASGEHVLEVRAMDRAGNVDPTPATFTFTVLLPWYRAPGFLAVGVGLLAALAALVGLVVSRHRRLERLVADRTSALAGANTQLREQIEREHQGEQERARLEAQLNQSQKLEAIGRLAGGVAHDFNNLLSVIGSYSELMLDELPADAALRTPAAEIAKASDRAAALTRQLLAFSRHQVVDAHPIDLNDVVGDIERMLRRLIGEHIELAVQRGDDLWRVHADRGQVEQVLFNLAANARDAMPQGGVLTIRTANVTLGGEFVRAHHGATEGPHVLLRVADTGIGMDADTASRVFEPFFTTKSVGMGSGLGLATVYGIVKRASGFIQVDSAPHRGTSFCIYLPRTELAMAEPVVRAMVSRPGGYERILIIEDADPVRALAATVLQRSGYEVVDVPSGEAAEQLFADAAFDVDLVLSDIVLTGMSGPQCAERLRRLRPGLRVLFMSGYADDTVVQFGRVDVHRTFLQKPFTPESLASKVREILDAPAEV
jgi:signal transduction histidine kinase/CheY-like chemotaxis protein